MQGGRASLSISPFEAVERHLQIVGAARLEAIGAVPALELVGLARVGEDSVALGAVAAAADGTGRDVRPCGGRRDGSDVGHIAGIADIVCIVGFNRLPFPPAFPAKEPDCHCEEFRELALVQCGMRLMCAGGHCWERVEMGSKLTMRDIDDTRLFARRVSESKRIRGIKRNEHENQRNV